jgi:DNA-binding transcriptional LysR family regulator
LPGSLNDIMPRAESAILAAAFRYFLAVAETGSVRAAAKELNIASSAVSRQIATLERLLGIQLFDRVGRGLKLSDAGALVLRNTRRTLSAYGDVVTALNAFKGLKHGRIKIATVESISVGLLPDLLAAFWQELPGIEIVVTVTGAEAVTRLIQDGEADIGFTFNPKAMDGLVIVYEQDFSIGALMSRAHPLAKRKTVSVKDCMEFPVALPARGLSLRAALERVLAQHAKGKQPRVQCNSLRLMATLARRNGCIAFQTSIGIEDDLRRKSLVLLPLSDREVPANRFVVMSEKGRTANPALTAFIEFARGHLRTNAAAG